MLCKHLVIHKILIAAVLCRSESDGVMMEDVDALQLELEAMLAATVVKKRTVAHEAKLIEDMERRGGSSSSKGPYLHDDHRLFRYLDPLSPCPHQCCQMAKFDPFLSLDCAPTPSPSTPAQSKERKGSNFAIWQH